ncbi:FliG C-terminal domain-containing protein [Parvularcula lutaonensis]|uniref:Flagellar motor switch protein FliG n=1 Tax=Parvularcula lutaonensis TaxID=491923 RepID=A0ABV7MD26_9PROT|nr:FliG C-terminal domain-containing protein [Parvularcula lutaonensis]GGY51565.1 hypothetical protein GCM10007148_20590 [Parvularcula lutaonensis]
MSETSLPAEPQRSAVPGTILRGPERAAVILSLLEPEVARGLAAHFDEGRIERAVATFESLGMVAKRDLLETVAQFIAALDGPVPVVAGGQKKARALANALTAANEDDPQAKQLDKPELEGSLADASDAEAVWQHVRQLSPEQLAALLKGERPALLAAVLQRVSRLAAGTVLETLDPAVATEVVRLIIDGRTPAPRTYDAIAHVLKRQADRITGPVEEARDATRELAEAFNTMPAAAQDAILQPLRQDLPDLTQKLENRLLRFAILQERLPKTVVPTIFREIDDKVIDKALKHALQHHPDTAEFLLASISQRLAEQIRERVEELPPVPPAEGEAAQTEIMRTLIRWAEEDRFTFKPPPDEAME